jgi:hypothetical protein
MAAYCSSGCVNCTSASECFECNIYTVLVNGICSYNACTNLCEDCLSVTYCFHCQARSVFNYTYFLNNNQYLKCQPCPHDCLTCYEDGRCSSCESTDFRELNNFRCLPLPGYFESNVNVAGRCSVGCSQCSSNTTCTACYLDFDLSNNQCYGTCP